MQGFSFKFAKEFFLTLWAGIWRIALVVACIVLVLMSLDYVQRHDWPSIVLGTFAILLLCLLVGAHYRKSNESLKTTRKI
jgi:hypothetical protein